jgi:hypothetical protein
MTRQSQTAFQNGGRLKQGSFLSNDDRAIRYRSNRVNTPVRRPPSSPRRAALLKALSLERVSNQGAGGFLEPPRARRTTSASGAAAIDGRYDYFKPDRRRQCAQGSYLADRCALHAAPQTLLRPLKSRKLKGGKFLRRRACALSDLARTSTAPGSRCPSHSPQSHSARSPRP